MKKLIYLGIISIAFTGFLGNGAIACPSNDPKTGNHSENHTSSSTSEKSFVESTVMVPTITPSGPVDLCVGGSVTLTSSPGVSYLWSTGATTQDILVTIAGDYYVTVDDGLGNIETSDTVTVTKYAAIPGGINYFIGSTVACPGQSLPYEINNVNRAVYYIWTLPAGATINGQAVYQTTNNSVIVDFDAGFTTSGNILVEAHNGCGVRGPNSKTVINAPPLTPAPITGSTIACPTNTYTYSTIQRAGVDTYTWSAPPGCIITGQGLNEVDITFPLGFIVGQVSVIAENSCGSSNPRSFYVRSDPPNPGTITGPVSALCNSVQTYSVPVSPYIDTYNWLAPAGSTVISGQGTPTVQISFNPGLNTGFVRVSATNACGTSGIKRLAIIGGVAISDHPADAGVCSGDAVFFAVAAPGSGLIYQWRKDGVNLTDDGIITGSDTDTLRIDPVAVSDDGLYDCIVRRSCGTADTSDIATLMVDGGPPQPGFVTGPLVACDGDAGVAYSFAPVVGATSYTWSGNTGVTIVTGQGTNSVTVDFGPTPLSGYELYIKALNGCGESDTTLVWIRTKVSTPNFTTGPTTVCAGTSNVVFESTVITGADSYNWIAPANAVVSSGQGTNSVTIDFDPSFTTGQVCVTASNICFTTPQRCRTITSTPNFPGGINGEGTNVCNSTQVYNINPVANATTYNWTIATGATITAGQGTNSVTVDFGPSFSSGHITVSTENSCGTSNPRSRLIYGTPAKPTAIFGDPAPCANSSGNVYSIDPLPGATSYTWTVPVGATITAGASTNSITVDFGPNGGGIYARGNNDCGSGAAGGLLIAFSCRQTYMESSPYSISLYPNPANDLISITIDQATGSGNISITDMSGREVLNSDFLKLEQNENLQLDISALSPGIYMISVITDSGTSFARFVRE
jgi:large repetitive protein